jgi:hypothetical protein
VSRYGDEPSYGRPAPDADCYARYHWFTAEPGGRRQLHRGDLWHVPTPFGRPLCDSPMIPARAVAEWEHAEFVTQRHICPACRKCLKEPPMAQERPPGPDEWLFVVAFTGMIEIINGYRLPNDRVCFVHPQLGVVQTQALSRYHTRGAVFDTFEAAKAHSRKMHARRLAADEKRLAESRRFAARDEQLTLDALIDAHRKLTTTWQDVRENDIQLD